MDRQVKRRRLNIENPSIMDGHPLKALTPLERDSWSGFCELESEPALFNVMLREFGVNGITVQEVVSLDDEMLQFLLKPIYGLIFLFRWKEDNHDKQEDSCPEGIWFANQTASFSCASVALLNIVNNIPGAELGEELQNFKDFTESFTPALRGAAIDDFQFIKKVHNSFARKMEVLSVDMQLKIEATDKKTKVPKRGQSDNEAEAGFHFIAFVPVKGVLWKFDGLERQPQNLGKYGDSQWLKFAAPEIKARMTEYEEEQTEFSVLSVAKDPMADLKTRFLSNLRSLSVIREKFLHNTSEWTNLSDSAIQLPNVTDQDLNKTNVPDMILGLESLEDGRKHWESLVHDQTQIKMAIAESQLSHYADEDYAAERRHDYGSAVHTWVRLLTKKKLIRMLAQEI